MGFRNQTKRPENADHEVFWGLIQTDVTNIWILWALKSYGISTVTLSFLRQEVRKAEHISRAR